MGTTYVDIELRVYSDKEDQPDIQELARKLASLFEHTPWQVNLDVHDEDGKFVPEHQPNQ